MLNLYDSQIVAIKNCFDSLKARFSSDEKYWPVQEKEDLILRAGMAFELGSGNACAVSGIVFTTDDSLVKENGVYFNDADFDLFSKNSEEEINYARIVVVKLKEEAIKDRKNQQLYAIFRKLEYQRFHSFLKEVGLRVSSIQNREVLRVSKNAVKDGISLCSMGLGFTESFKNLPEVEKVQVYIAASTKKEDEPVFEELKKISEKADFITGSLNEIFKGLKMDCNHCGQKKLCDEINGMKELHQSAVNN